VEYFLITFQSTHQYMKAEKTLKDLDYDCTLLHIPSEISADCGLGLKFSSSLDHKKLKKIIMTADINFDGLYYIKKGDNEKNIEKVE